MMEDRKEELGNKPIGPLLIRYSTPAMTAMFVSSMYNLVDTIFVGYGAGTLALAGLAISFPVQMVILAVGMTVGIGTASVVSRSLGAGDQRRAERAAGTSFAVTAVLAIAMAAAGLTFIDPLLRVFGATDAVLPYGKDYLSIIMFGNVFFAVTVSSNNVARSEGAVKIAMRSMIIGAVVNVVLDPSFIFGLDRGIRGAAVATVIANVCTFTYLCVYFSSGKSMLRIKRSDLLPDWAIVPEVFRIGGVSFFHMVAGSLMAIPINFMIVRHGADVHLAIMGVANRSMMFFFMPIYGMVQGLQPIIGFNYGAGNMDRVVEAVRKAVLYTTVLSSGAFLILMLATRPVLSMFSPDAVLIAEGVPIVRIISIVVPFVGFHMVGSSLFQALGRARPAFVLTLSRQVLILLPLVLIVPGYYGLTGLWVSFPIADIASVVLTALFVYAELRSLGRRSVPAVIGEELAAEQSANP